MGNLAVLYATFITVTLVRAQIKVVAVVFVAIRDVTFLALNQLEYLVSNFFALNYLSSALRRLVQLDHHLDLHPMNNHILPFLGLPHQVPQDKLFQHLRDGEIREIQKKT